MILQILFGSSQGGNNFIENLINRNRPAPAPIPAPQQPQVFQGGSSSQYTNPNLFLTRNSTIRCHQPQSNTGGFNLSLQGFNPDLFVRRNP